MNCVLRTAQSVRRYYSWPQMNDPFDPKKLLIYWIDTHSVLLLTYLEKLWMAKWLEIEKLFKDVTSSRMLSSESNKTPLDSSLNSPLLHKTLSHLTSTIIYRKNKMKSFIMMIFHFHRFYCVDDTHRISRTQ